MGKQRKKNTLAHRRLRSGRCYECLNFMRVKGRNVSARASNGQKVNSVHIPPLYSYSVGANSLWVRLQISPLIDGTCPHARGDHLNAGAVSKLITRRASDARSLSAQLRCRGSEYEANYLSGCLLLLSLPPGLLQAAKGDVVFFFVRARSAAHNLQRIRGCTKKRKKIKRRAEERKNGEKNVHPMEFSGFGIPRCVQQTQPPPSPADAPHVLAAPICSTLRGIHK